MRDFIKRNGKLLIAFSLWVVPMILLVYFFSRGYISPKIFSGMIGPVIAIGPPAIYYFYTEHIRHPEISLGEIKHHVAPMYRRVSINGNEFFLPNIGRVAVFTTVKVENIGRATAENCMVRIKARDKNFDARWNRSSNPERYNLLPGESRKVQLFKTFISPNFFFLKTNWKEDNKDKIKILRQLQEEEGEDLLGETLVDKIPPARNPRGAIQYNIKDGTPEFTREHIDPWIARPRDKPPELRETSMRGGWNGKKVKEGEVEIKIQAIAEDYKTKEESKGSFALPQDLITGIGKGDVEWQHQWDSKGYGKFKSNVIEACKSQIEKRAT